MEKFGFAVVVCWCVSALFWRSNWWDTANSMKQTNQKQSVDKKRLLIVGNGMATGRLLDEIAKRAPEKFDITVVGDEIHGSYNRIMLSPVLAEEASVESIIQKPGTWYVERNIQFISGTRVTSIDQKEQCAQLSTGESFHFDHCVLAIGSRPARIPAENQFLENIYSFRTIEDVNRISSASSKARSAVVVGGGLLGLEAAYGLALKGLDVTVVHRSASLLNRQLDEQAGEYLRRVMQDKNIQFELSSEVLRFNGETQLESVELNNGKTLECDVAVIATGISPNKELAESAGLTCNRAICVDDHMTTSNRNISALGECCEHNGNTFGLVEPIWAQCISLAEHICNEQAHPFVNASVATKLKVSGVQVFSAGEYKTQTHQREMVLSDPKNRIYRKLILEEGRIVGIVLFGDTRGGTEYFQLMMAGVDVSSLLPNLVINKSFIGDIEDLLTRNEKIAA